MQQIDGKDLSKVIVAKGFRLVNDKSDKVYRLYDRDRPTVITTKISHGNKTYSYKNKLLGKVRRQLGLRSKSELRRYIECSMSLSEYLSLLRNRLVI